MMPSSICDALEAYGDRRVGAALGHQGLVVKGKRIRRLMGEHDLQPKRRRRFIVTTHGDHDGPIFPNLAKDRMPSSPNQLWVADLTYVAIQPASWTSPRPGVEDRGEVVGYAIGRSIDVRLKLAALKGRPRGSPAAVGLHPLLGHRRGLQHPKTPLRARLPEPGFSSRTATPG